MFSKTARALIWVTCVILLAIFVTGMYKRDAGPSPRVPTIALIPQIAGVMLWEAEHSGARAAAEKLKVHLHWNAPTSEIDVSGQVALLDRIGRGHYQGLVLAPNHPRALNTPLRRALATGLPVVIVSARTDFPANGKLGYIVNDDEKMGELAAAEIARLIHGRGSIAIVGLARYGPGINLRVRGAEHLLASQFPNIHIASRLAGAYNTALAEELMKGALDANPDLKAVLSFTASSTRGVYNAVKSRTLQQGIRLVGCEQDTDLLRYVGTGGIAAILAENTYRMGYDAIELISASWAGKAMPALSVVPPVLISKQNFKSAEINLFTSFPR